MSKDVLIAEISGKRPGTSKQRPTEKYETHFDKVIISNNSEGYETDWDIINVPDDYKEWYIANIKSSENAWYAPMNRSYAIKYAREHGYKYLVQLDDNIIRLEIATYKESEGIAKRYRKVNKPGMLDDFIEMFCLVLENTNAAMVGCQLSGIGTPDNAFLRERYVYSIFALDLSCCPDVFQGDFEDDVEYRLKLSQMGLPVVQISPLRYSKVGQARNKDLTGCRAEYARVGLMRGEHMSKLYNPLYTCELRRRRNTVNAKCVDDDPVNFKHHLQPFKVGVIVYDIEPIKTKLKEMFAKYSEDDKDKVIIKEKKVKAK